MSAFLGDYAEFARRRGKDKRKRKRRVKTWVKSGPFGLGLKRGKSMAVSPGSSQKEIARAFYEREKRAGRL